MNWRWLGGFFDGEGTIHLGIVGNSIQAVCRVTQATQNDGERIMKEIKDFLTEEGVVTNDTDEVFLAGRDSMWNVAITGRDNVMAFLRKMAPYLNIKRKKAEDVLRFLIMFKMSPKVRGMLITEGKLGLTKIPTRRKKVTVREMEVIHAHPSTVGAIPSGLPN